MLWWRPLRFSSVMWALKRFPQPPLQHPVSNSPLNKTGLKGKKRKKGSVPSLILTSLFRLCVFFFFQGTKPFLTHWASFECTWSCMWANWQGSPQPCSYWWAQVPQSKGCVGFFSPMSVPNNSTQERKAQSHRELESLGHLSTWLWSKIAVRVFFLPCLEVLQVHS